MPKKPRKSKAGGRRPGAGAKIRGTARRVPVRWSFDPTTRDAVEADAARTGEPASQCAERVIRARYGLPPLAPNLPED